MNDTLTDLDRTRADCHRAIDQIAAAWPKAVDDKNAVGWRSGGDGVNRSVIGDHSDPTQSMAIHPSKEAKRAADWIVDLGTVLHEWVLRGASVPAQSQVIDVMHQEVERQATIGILKRSRPPVVHLLRVADTATGWWPPAPKAGETVGDVTVGERTNRAEVCTLCREPVTSGKNDNGQALLRRINGDPYHGSGPGCFWKVARSRKAI